MNSNHTYWLMCRMRVNLAAQNRHELAYFHAAMGYIDAMLAADKITIGQYRELHKAVVNSEVIRD